MKKGKERLCELCDTLKRNNLWIIVVPEGEERKNGAESLLNK